MWTSLGDRFVGEYSEMVVYFNCARGTQEVDILENKVQMTYTIKQQLNFIR